MTLPIPSIGTGLKVQKARPKLHVSVTAINAPWELIDTPTVAQRVPVDLKIIATKWMAPRRGAKLAGDYPTHYNPALFSYNASLIVLRVHKGKLTKHAEFARGPR
jgi:hypothetical protein